MSVGLIFFPPVRHPLRAVFLYYAYSLCFSWKQGLLKWNHKIHFISRSFWCSGLNPVSVSVSLTQVDETEEGCWVGISDEIKSLTLISSQVSFYFESAGRDLFLDEKLSHQRQKRNREKWRKKKLQSTISAWMFLWTKRLRHAVCKNVVTSISGIR